MNAIQDTVTGRVKKVQKGSTATYVIEQENGIEVNPSTWLKCWEGKVIELRGREVKE